MTTCELPPDGTIEAGLYALEQITTPGKSWTEEEVAKACGVTRYRIRIYEMRAIKKLREQLREGAFE